MCLGIGRGAGRRDEMPRPQNLIADSILMSLAHEITQTEDIQNEDMCNARTRGRSPVISKPTESQTQAKHVDHQSRSHSSPPDNRATAPSNTSLNPEPSESSTLPIRSVSPPPVLLGMKTPHRRHLHSPSASPSTKPSRMKLATGMVIDDGMTIGQRVAANRRTPQMASIVRHEDDEMGYADDEGGEEEDGVVREFKGGLSPPVLSLQKTKKSWRVVGGDGEDMVMSVVEEPVTVAAPSLMSLSAEDNGWSTVGTSDLSLGSMSNNTATSWWAPPNSSWPASVLSLQPSSSLPWVDDTGLMALAAESPLSVDDMCVDDGDAAPSRVAKPIPIYRIRETVEGFGKIPAFLLRPVSPLPVSSINTLNPDRSQLILYRPVSAPPSLDDASTSQKIVRFARRKVDGNDGDDDGEGRSSAAIITASRSKIHHHHNHNPLQQKTTSVRMLGVEEAGLESGRMDLD
ncbi:hypothetical protein BC829DRAFT_412810 [Chytridium lagenaria]|nr:hypothetical protein BC829DRAFT_412810 [Chytridium lagenaria]